MQVNQPIQQEFVSQVQAAIADKRVTPEEMQTLQATVDGSELPPEEKAALVEVLNRLAGFPQQEGDQSRYLTDPQLHSLQALVAQLNSPAATALAEHVTQNNEIPPAREVSGRPPAQETKSNRSFFGMILDGIKAILKLIGSLFVGIGNLLGAGDKNNAQARQQSNFLPNGTQFPTSGGTAGTEVDTAVSGDDAGPRRTRAPLDSAAVSRYMAASEAHPTGEMYQRSAHHDDHKFVPRFPIAAFHESGVYRHAEDPYAVGAISRPQKSEDLGGKTYGTYQFESSVYLDGSSRNNQRGAGSTLDRFLNDDNPFSAQLKAVAQQHGLASNEFDALWTQLSREHNKEFGLAQEAFVLQDKGRSVERFMDTAGLSEEVRQDPRIVDLIMGTTNQVGSLATRAAEHIAQLQSQAGRSLTANEVGLAIAEYKETQIASWFVSSPGAHNGVRNRYQAEGEIFTA